MNAARSNMRGSDYVGVFCTANERNVFVSDLLESENIQILESTLGAKAVRLTLGDSDLIGLLCRANSNGIVVSNLAHDEEVERLRQSGLNVLHLKSRLNAIGSNILANDRIAIINPDYSDAELKEIADALGVETIRPRASDFKTVGANNILTNSGLVVNNKVTEPEKAEWDRATGFSSVRSTAATGALAIGLATVSNTKGVVAGNSTTGFELSRIVNALE